jgi:hypothetical protein
MASRRHRTFGTAILGRGLFAAAAFAALVACSADAVDEAPATLETVGAFVARTDPEGGFRLHRVLYVLRLPPMDSTLFITVYATRTSTIEQAREAAKGPALPIEVPVELFSKLQFASVPHEIVWFRSLTQEERDRVQ